MKTMQFSESSEAEREKIGGSLKMDRSSGNGGGGGYWFWALASVGQLAAGVLSYRRGYAGDSHIMPFKAFTVASLFVGAGATSVAGFLHFSGIHKWRFHGPYWKPFCR